jgi:predicted XRE-type DNA-binding protein
MSHRIEHTKSSGNVFADLGLSNPEERRLKADLAVEIRRIIERKGWTQAQAAELIGLDQPKVSKLLRGQLSGFSVDRLFNVLNRLGHNIEIRISAEEHAPGEAHMYVTVG